MGRPHTNGSWRRPPDCHRSLETLQSCWIKELRQSEQTLGPIPTAVSNISLRCSSDQERTAALRGGRAQAIGGGVYRALERWHGSAPRQYGADLGSHYDIVLQQRVDGGRVALRHR